MHKHKVEIASEALNRYINFIKQNLAHKKDLYLPVYETTCIKSINESILTKYNVPLAKSYQIFIEQYGFIKFGEKTLHDHKFVYPNKTMAMVLSTIGRSEWEIKRLENLIIFSYGDELLQGVHYYCFDALTYCTITQEMDIVEFHPNEPEALFDMNSYRRWTDGFDEHISCIIDAKLDFHLAY